MLNLFTSHLRLALAWRRSLRILAVVIASGIFNSHVLLAQSGTVLTDINLVVQAAMGSDHVAGLEDELNAVLQREITAGKKSRSINGFFSDPMEFHELLLDKYSDSIGTAGASYSAQLADSIALYSDEYSIPTGCVFNPLELPNSVDLVLQQIEYVARASQRQALLALEQSSHDELAQNLPSALSLLLSSPYASGLEREQYGELRDYVSTLSEAKLANVLCATEIWSLLLKPEWITNLKQLMSSADSFPGDVIAQRSTDLGEIILSGSGDLQLLTDNVLFIADLSGNDFYGLESKPMFNGAPQLIIDFEGDDVYESSRRGGIASGVGSSSFLLDFEGDDSYHSQSLSLGSAILGAGVLIDLAGNDEYNAGELSQGLSLFGLGLLFDQSGEDIYRLGALGQGVGMSNGYGALYDLSGDDVYEARGSIATSYGTPGLADAWVQGLGLGLRGIAPGGVGILFDGAGSDRYNAGSFSQGGGYYYGLGVFHDRGKANDEYRGSRYNFGWGAHAGAGYFYEEGGNDSYSTRQIVAAGLAWDHSLVLFADMEGDDLYDLGDFSLAASAINSIAYFIDGDGADTYLHVAPGKASEEPPNLSVFIDVGAQENEFDSIDGSVNCSRQESWGFVFIIESLNSLADDCASPSAAN